MTPVPWKKSCRWKSTDLFVGSGLVLTDSKAKRSLTDIDEECKLQYNEIFNHNRLKAEKRVILEGEPGSGKTMMSSQLAYDWSQGKITEVDILIFLPLKFVNSVTLVVAVKRFYFSSYDIISVNDIESFLTNEDLQSCLILDGLEEYNSGRMTPAGEPSEVTKVMEKSKFPNCKVILTSRSDYAKDLPTCPMLRIGRFGENERNTYIEKVFADDTEKQQEIKRVIENTPFILDLCSVPLLFVLAVHNVKSMGSLQEDLLNRVSPFVENMVKALCPLSDSDREDCTIDAVGVSKKATLEELAYSGLCKGRQVLSWRKDTLERDIPNLKRYLDSGILVVEEGIVKGHLRSIQDETEKDKSPRKEKKAKKSKKEATEVDQTNESIQGVSGATASPLHQGHVVEEGLSGTLKSKRSVSYDTKEPMSRRKRLLKRLTPKILMKKKTLHGEVRQETVSSERTEELPANENEQIGRGPGTRESAASPSSESESTPSESESELSELHQTSSGPTAKDFPLEVKFLHKVIQEWFASKHFSSILRKSWTENTHGKLLGNVLPQISPIDLHYILRFTSYLCPPSCHLIMDFLLKDHGTAEEVVPEYILNCVCLCFAEYNGIMEPCMKAIVSKLCAEIIPIRSDESRLIQQSKVALMRFAASVGILIKGVHLIDVVSEVGEKSLMFNSGVVFDVFNMIQVIEMSRWDQHLEEKDYENVLKLVLCSNSIRKARLHFPSQPPMVDKEALEDVVDYDKTVEWVIGPKLIETLNLETGTWEMTFNKKDDVNFIESKQMGAAQEAYSWHEQSIVDAEAVISREGGTLCIPNTGVKLYVPPNAFVDNIDQCLLQMRIVLPGAFDEPATSFTSNTSAVVELLPNNLKLKQTVILTLPHCLDLEMDRGDGNYTAKIFISHHGKGTSPVWEAKSNLLYYLDDTKCIIWLESFCWVKFEVNGAIVKGKKIQVFAAGKILEADDNIVETEIGYFPDLPSGGEILRNNKDLILSQQKPFVFLKKTKLPLTLSLSTVTPLTWKPLHDVREIPYESIANSVEHSCPFIFQNESQLSPIPVCIYWISQGRRGVELTMRPKALHTVLQNRGEEKPRESEEPLLDCFLFLKRMLDKDWKDFGRYLRLSEAEISHVKCDNNDDVRECTYQMLLTWQRKNGSRATSEKLVEALEKLGRKDLAETLPSL